MSRAALSVVAALVGLASSAVFAPPVHAQADLFDVAGGAVVTDHSPLRAGEQADELLGGVAPNGPEPGTLIFGDTASAGSIHFVEWQTAAPVTVARIRLLAVADGCTSGRRAMSHFRLLADVGGNLEPLVDEAVAVPYQYVRDCSLAVLFALSFPATTSTRFRAEFTQFTDENAFRGPRVVELDGLPTASCGDANDDTVIRATDGFIALRSAVGAGFCEECACDVNDDGQTSATDALSILRVGVGHNVPLTCPACDLGPAAPAE